jgi:hypothetical protein
VSLALALGRVTGAPVRMLGLDLDGELIARAKVGSDVTLLLLVDCRLLSR